MSDKTILQLAVEIRNLAHLGWKDRPNAELLFREIGCRAQAISRLAYGPQAIHEVHTLSQCDGSRTICGIPVRPMPPTDPRVITMYQPSPDKHICDVCAKGEANE